MKNILKAYLPKVAGQNNQKHSLSLNKTKLKSPIISSRTNYLKSRNVNSVFDINNFNVKRKKVRNLNSLNSIDFNGLDYFPSKLAENQNEFIISKLTLKSPDSYTSKIVSFDQEVLPALTDRIKRCEDNIITKVPIKTKITVDSVSGCNFKNSNNINSVNEKFLRIKSASNINQPLNTETNSTSLINDKKTVNTLDTKTPLITIKSNLNNTSLYNDGRNIESSLYTSNFKSHNNTVEKENNSNHTINSTITINKENNNILQANHLGDITIPKLNFTHRKRSTLKIPKSDKLDVSVFSDESKNNLEHQLVELEPLNNISSNLSISELSELEKVNSDKILKFDKLKSIVKEQNYKDFYNPTLSLLEKRKEKIKIEPILEEPHNNEQKKENNNNLNQMIFTKKRSSVDFSSPERRSETDSSLKKHNKNLNILKNLNRKKFIKLTTIRSEISNTESITFAKINEPRNTLVSSPDYSNSSPIVSPISTSIQNKYNNSDHKFNIGLLNCNDDSQTLDKKKEIIDNINNIVIISDRSNALDSSKISSNLESDKITDQNKFKTKTTFKSKKKDLSESISFNSEAEQKEDILQGDLVYISEIETENNLNLKISEYNKEAYQNNNIDDYIFNTVQNIFKSIIKNYDNYEPQNKSQKTKNTSTKQLRKISKKETLTIKNPEALRSAKKFHFNIEKKMTTKSLPKFDIDDSANHSIKQSQIDYSKLDIIKTKASNIKLAYVDKFKEDLKLELISQSKQYLKNKVINRIKECKMKKRKVNSKSNIIKIFKNTCTNILNDDYYNNLMFSHINCFEKGKILLGLEWKNYLIANYFNIHKDILIRLFKPKTDFHSDNNIDATYLQEQNEINLLKNFNMSINLDSPKKVHIRALDKSLTINKTPIITSKKFMEKQSNGSIIEKFIRTPSVKKILTSPSKKTTSKGINKIILNSLNSNYINNFIVRDDFYLKDTNFKIQEEDEFGNTSFNSNINSKTSKDVRLIIVKETDKENNIDDEDILNSKHNIIILL